mmetsp:Transcript_23073/g.58497  ORF Transcript_23073/g.58497 Transcript_23073/m.58497 type:complete len:96 (+) Transcript_23073:268-555(+)
MVSSSNVSVGIFVLALSLVFFFAVAESLTSPTQLYASKACSLGGSFSDRDAQLQCQLNSTQGVQDGVISLMFGGKVLLFHVGRMLLTGQQKRTAE